MNLLKGDRIKWTERVFTGSFSAPKYAGDRTIQGIILKESYGKKSGQHTFTIFVEKAEITWKESYIQIPAIGEKITRKGRNLYPNIFYHEAGLTGEEREREAEDKKRRSQKAKEEKEFY